MEQHPKQTEKPAVEKPSDRCQACGWHFDIDNKRRRFYSRHFPHKTRTEPRQVIFIRTRDGAGITRCDLCYQREQWRAGTHPHQGTPQEALARQAIFSEFLSWDDDKRRRAVYDEKAGKYRLDVPF